MKSLFKKSKSKNIKNKYSNKNINFHKNKKSSKKLTFRGHLKTIKKNIKHKHKRHIRNQKGGVGDIWTFKQVEHFESYARYIFGSEERTRLWQTLLDECTKRKIPVFVITSGDRKAIERMLQLTEIDQCIKEVLSIRKDEITNPNPRFRGLTTKAQVIDAILKELQIPCEPGEIVGAFIDDQPHNFDGLPTCIQKIHAVNKDKNGNSVIPTDASQRSYNVFRKEVFFSDHLTLNLTLNPVNYIPHDILMAAYYGISEEKIPGKPNDKQIELVEMFKKTKVLFLDCDGVISVWPGVFSFEKKMEFIASHINKFPKTNPVEEKVEVVPTLKSAESAELLGTLEPPPPTPPPPTPPTPPTQPPTQPPPPQPPTQPPPPPTPPPTQPPPQ